MNHQSLRRISVAACLGILSCTPSTNVPGTDLFLEAADGEYHGPMESIRIMADAEMLEVAETLTLSAIGVFEDGTEISVGQHVYWGAEGDGMAISEGAPGQVIITGTKAGTPVTTIQLGKLIASRTFTVVPASLRTLEVSGTDSISRGGGGQLIVTGTFGDGSTQVLSEVATWSSSDASILTVSDTGLAIGVGLGSATVTAKIDEVVSVEFAVTVVCVYPEDAGTLVVPGRTFPNATWTNAIFPGPTSGPLSMEAVYCQEGDYEDVKVLLFQVSAEWCGPCKSWRRDFNRQRPMFDDNNALFLVTEIEDVSGVANVTSEHANMSIRQELGDDWGVRLGDFETTPTRNLFNASRIVREFPTLVAVRTRDMKVIATSTGQLGVFANALPTMLANPDWDWSDVANPLPQFISNCAAGQEESYEPNDTTSTAKEIGEGAVQGGICTEAPDYYRVTLDGDWRLTMQSEVAVGDLDVYVWDETTGQPLMRNNFPVGAYTNQDIETFDFTGPAVIRIEGKATASAAYTLYIQAK